MPSALRIGTRGSPLALAQTRWVEARLKAHHPGLNTELVVIRTTGDKLKDVPLAKVGGKGLFIKEIEEALLAGEVDLAVHSLKDMPAELPPGCVLGAVPPREDHRDVFISRQYQGLAQIPPGGRVGTGSLRRKVQILHRYPHLEVVPLRGNVDTRLRKLAGEGLDAIILAAAGLKRLGVSVACPGYLAEEEMLPAIGQGALGLEVRADDQKLLRLLAPLDHPPSRFAVAAERAFLKHLQGGCQVPIAALGKWEPGALTLEGLLSDLEGRRLLRDRLQGRPEEAEVLGQRLAERLLAQGGDQILEEIYQQPA